MSNTKITTTTTTTASTTSTKTQIVSGQRIPKKASKTGGKSSSAHKLFTAPDRVGTTKLALDDVDRDVDIDTTAADSSRCLKRLRKHDDDDGADTQPFRKRVGQSSSRAAVLYDINEFDYDFLVDEIREGRRALTKSKDMDDEARTMAADALDLRSRMLHRFCHTRSPRLDYTRRSVEADQSLPLPRFIGDWGFTWFDSKRMQSTRPERRIPLLAQRRVCLTCRFKFGHDDMLRILKAQGLTDNPHKLQEVKLLDHDIPEAVQRYCEEYNTATEEAEAQVGEDDDEMLKDEPKVKLEKNRQAIEACCLHAVIAYFCDVADAAHAHAKETRDANEKAGKKVYADDKSDDELVLYDSTIKDPVEKAEFRRRCVTALAGDNAPEPEPEPEHVGPQVFCTYPVEHESDSDEAAHMDVDLRAQHAMKRTKQQCEEAKHRVKWDNRVSACMGLESTDTPGPEVDGEPVSHLMLLDVVWDYARDTTRAEQKDEKRKREEEKAKKKAEKESEKEQKHKVKLAKRRADYKASKEKKRSDDAALAARNTVTTKAPATASVSAAVEKALSSAASAVVAADDSESDMDILQRMCPAKSLSSSSSSSSSSSYSSSSSSRTIVSTVSHHHTEVIDLCEMEDVIGTLRADGVRSSAVRKQVPAGSTDQGPSKRPRMAPVEVTDSDSN